jgi:integrase
MYLDEIQWRGEEVRRAPPEPQDNDYGLPANPALGVRSRRRGDAEDPEKSKVLELDQLGRLLDALREETRLLDFLFRDGPSGREAIELRWGDVDMVSGRLSIARQFSRGKLRKPKGNKTREVRLSARMTLGTAVAAWRPTRRSPRLNRRARRTADHLEHDEAHVEAGRSQGRVGEWIIEGGRKRAESWVGFHTFRHTCATQLFLRGWNAKQVSVFLGHSDAGFTLRAYVHPLTDDLPQPGLTTK